LVDRAHRAEDGGQRVPLRDPEHRERLRVIDGKQQPPQQRDRAASTRLTVDDAEEAAHRPEQQGPQGEVGRVIPDRVASEHRVIDGVQRGGEGPPEREAQPVVRPPGGSHPGRHPCGVSCRRQRCKGRGETLAAAVTCRQLRLPDSSRRDRSAAERRKVERQAQGDDQGRRRSAQGRPFSCIR
jgi:hypothetical protein